MIFRTAW